MLQLGLGVRSWKGGDVCHVPAGAHSAVHDSSMILTVLPQFLHRTPSPICLDRSHLLHYVAVVAASDAQHFAG
jgi:hypothetical protein